MKDIDIEYHFKIAYSILESSKLKIKTNYLNYFEIDRVIFPDILKIMKTFYMFNHIKEVFISVSKPNPNEIIDEFTEIDESIKKFNKILPSKFEETLEVGESLCIKDFDIKEVNKTNWYFLSEKKPYVAKAKRLPRLFENLSKLNLRSCVKQLKPV